MPPPDVALAYLLIGVAALSCLGFTAVLALTRPSYPGWRAWALSLLSFTGGITLGLLRRPDALLLSVLLGNGLLALSGVLAVRAFRRFAEVERRLERVTLLAALPLMGGLVYFTLVVPDLRVRVLLVVLHTFLATSLIVGLSVRRAARQAGRRVGFVLTAVSFALVLALGLPRSVLVWRLSPDELSVLPPSVPLLALLLTSFMVFVLGGTLSMLALHDDRRRQEVQALEDHLRQLSVTDPLTGLFNRRGLGAAFGPDAAGTWAAPSSFAVLDLDHFKRVNDRYGHATGDRCLQLLARVLRDATRASDVVARYGGEEFLVLLPGTGASDAVQVLDRVRRQVDQEARQAGLPALTFSAGVVERQGGETLESLFERADALLFRAKAEGRDRVVTG